MLIPLEPLTTVYHPSLYQFVLWYHPSLYRPVSLGTRRYLPHGYLLPFVPLGFLHNLLGHHGLCTVTIFLSTGTTHPPSNSEASDKLLNLSLGRHGQATPQIATTTRARALSRGTRPPASRIGRTQTSSLLLPSSLPQEPTRLRAQPLRRYRASGLRQRFSTTSHLSSGYI